MCQTYRYVRTTKEEQLTVAKAVRLLDQLPDNALETAKGWKFTSDELQRIPGIDNPERWAWMALRWLFGYELKQLPGERQRMVIRNIQRCLATSQA